MFQTVDVGRRVIRAYRGVAPDPILDDLVRLAEGLRGMRVVHINATPYGGGVSELLRSLVPLMNDLGIMTDWKILSGAEPFFRVTKKIHNGLQGAKVDLTAEERKVYLEESERNARLFEERYDFVFVHDPQPAGLLRFREKGDSRWIWRCHIDTSDPDRSVWEFLKGFLNGYDAAIFTLREFIPPDFPLDRVAVVPPAIDPLSPKSIPLPDMIARQVLGWIGVETDRPLLTQVSRFDPWKDPMGVIAAYRLVRKEVPDLQLALVGSMALDDPEGWEIYKAIREESVADPLVHLFTNLTGVGNIEVNAFQRLSDVIVQKSIREGFGLVVSEAMWKGTPVVAGRAGGIPLQMADGVGGVLVESIEECCGGDHPPSQTPRRGGGVGQAGSIACAGALSPPAPSLKPPLIVADPRRGPPDRAVSQGGLAGSRLRDGDRAPQHRIRLGSSDLFLLLRGMPKPVPDRSGSIPLFPCVRLGWRFFLSDGEPARKWRGTFISYINNKDVNRL